MTMFVRQVRTLPVRVCSCARNQNLNALMPDEFTNQGFQSLKRKPQLDIPTTGYHYLELSTRQSKRSITLHFIYPQV